MNRIHPFSGSGKGGNPISVRRQFLDLYGARRLLAGFESLARAARTTSKDPRVAAMESLAREARTSTDPRVVIDALVIFQMQAPTVRGLYAAWRSQ